jgi:hypothetical protein
MRYIALLFFGLVLISCAPQKQTSERTLKKGPLSDGESKEILRSEVLGKAIFEQDAIAARATDVLIADIKTLTPQSVSGWIVVYDTQGSLVRFILEKDNKLQPVYDVRINNAGEGTVFKNELRPLSDEEEAMFRARQNALKAAPLDCSDRYNTVVLEDPESDGLLVYVLAVSMENKVMAGGNSCVKLSKDGKEVLTVARLSKSCLAIDKLKVLGGAKPTIFFMSQLVGDAPSPVHVYLNYLHNLDFYVATNTRNWHISKGKIRVLE